VRVRFLLDENLNPDLQTALLRLDPTIDILRVGDSGAPPLETLDPEILDFCEREKRLLITDNRKSMPGHLKDHWARGGQFWGLCWVRPEYSIGTISEILYEIWGASEAEEWIDRTEWIPF